MSNEAILPEKSDMPVQSIFITLRFSSSSWLVGRIAKGVISGKLSKEKLSKEELASYAKEGRCFLVSLYGPPQKGLPEEGY